MNHYRVFVSYAHADRALVEQLVNVLNEAGLVPLWDRDLIPGTGFSEQIQSFITNSHIFLPFITPASAERPWLHQEIGFALALGKPIVPVTLGGSPIGIISGIQAVQLQSDLTDARLKLSAKYFGMLLDSLPERPATYECTEDNARRALLLARYADSIWSIQRHGMVRQMASLTTFHLPSRGAGDPIWKKYFPANADDRFLFDALRKERMALQRHAQAAGCRLILDPVERLERIYERRGAGSVPFRVRGLLEFLRDDSVSDVVVAINDEPERKNSLTLVGDWFSSEAVSSGEMRILREAVFTRDAPTVLRQIEDFDHRMQDLLAMRHWDEASSRDEAISYLQNYLESVSDE